MQSVLFCLFSAVSIMAAIAMILQRYMVYSIGLMIVVLLGIAGLFLTLNATFLAVVQVIVYAGAVMVLFVFSAMIVGEKDSPDLSVGDPFSWIVLGIVTTLLMNLAVIVAYTPLPIGPGGTFQQDVQGGHPILPLGSILFTEYSLALQSVGLVLLVALVGAVYLSEEGST
jgi:NADH-quinone oxidoreductase subunit J